ncbi:MAG: hypothetical protein M5F18_06880 [Asgard group archaeon]|nr:hypothetical protein [Asgard group archaeon]
MGTHTATTTYQMQSKRNLDQLILAIMVSTILANNVTHQFVISDNNGSTYFR